MQERETRMRADRIREHREPTRPLPRGAEHSSVDTRLNVLLPGKPWLMVEKFHVSSGAGQVSNYVLARGHSVCYIRLLLRSHPYTALKKTFFWDWHYKTNMQRCIHPPDPMRLNHSLSPMGKKIMMSMERTTDREKLCYWVNYPYKWVPSIGLIKDTLCSSWFHVLSRAQHSLHAIYGLTETPCGPQFDYKRKHISTDVYL